jgi:hypothetical protein
MHNRARDAGMTQERLTKLAEAKVILRPADKRYLN